MIGTVIALPPLLARILYNLLALALVGAVPLVGWYATARLRAAPSSGARLKAYRLIMLLVLLGVGAAIFLVPPSSLLVSQMRNRGATWLPSRELISGLAVALVLLTALPVLLARRVAAFRADFLRQAQRFRDLLPQTRSERAWFAAAALCAGACEEVLYRGFLVHYLHVFPWRLNIAATILIACAVFGIAHLYRGVNGLLPAVLLALGQCLLFLCTRSLALPILLHVLIDLRVVSMLPMRQQP